VKIRPDPAAAPATNATFQVLASGSNPLSSLTYQWHFNSAAIPRATNSTLTISNVQAGDWGEYTVAVSDDVGTARSAPAWLYPVVRMGFVFSPLSQSVGAGNVVSLSAVATGWPPPFVFEWRRGSTPLVTNEQDTLAGFFQFTAPSAAGSQTYRAVVRNVGLPQGSASGTATITVLADSDGDALPDAWELMYGLRPDSPVDRFEDSDGDGLLNGEEYLAGTNPTNALSVLKLVAFTDGAHAWLAFDALSNKTYTLQSTDRPGGASWSKLADCFALPTNRFRFMTPLESWTNRFYRVTTPQQP
jgi:hypothetical protein